MEIRLVAVEIHEERLFLPTGAVGRWATSVARQLERHGKREAPTGRDSGRVNKSRRNQTEPVGSLKRGISAGATRTGPTSYSITLASLASYSTYVIKGTGTTFSKSARIPRGQPGAGQFATLGPKSGMYLPGNPGYGASKFVQRRKGQRPNNFMQRAVDKTAVRHSSLRGFKMV